MYMMYKKKPKKRASVIRNINNGTMSEAEFKSFIISALRNASKFWKPITATKWNARKSRGIYKCEKCGKEWKEYSPAPSWKKRRVKEFAVDHKIPVVWKEGFSSYDDWIRRAFIETGEGLRLLCKECHDYKTNLERKKRSEWKKKTE